MSEFEEFLWKELRNRFKNEIIEKIKDMSKNRTITYLMNNVTPVVGIIMLCNKCRSVGFYVLINIPERYFKELPILIAWLINNYLFCQNKHLQIPIGYLVITLSNITKINKETLESKEYSGLTCLMNTSLGKYAYITIPIDLIDGKIHYGKPEEFYKDVKDKGGIIGGRIYVELPRVYLDDEGKIIGMMIPLEKESPSHGGIAG